MCILIYVQTYCNTCPNCAVRVVFRFVLILKKFSFVFFNFKNRINIFFVYVISLVGFTIIYTYTLKWVNKTINNAYRVFYFHFSMKTNIISTLTLFVTFCVSSVTSSSYYNNDFFTRIQSKEVIEHWSKEVNMHSFIEEFSCEHIAS